MAVNNVNSIKIHLNVLICSVTCVASSIFWDSSLFYIRWWRNSTASWEKCVAACEVAAFSESSSRGRQGWETRFPAGFGLKSRWVNARVGCSMAWIMKPYCFLLELMWHYGIFDTIYLHVIICTEILFIFAGFSFSHYTTHTVREFLYMIDRWFPQRPILLELSAFIYKSKTVLPTVVPFLL